MRHVFLVNPVSGKADASLTLVPRIVEACAAAGVDYEITLTEYPGHGARLARQWAETGEPVRLYACGGDGTFNEVLRGAMGWANAAVGCVPCGSGNDFIRNYGTAEQFLNLDAQLNGSEQAIDLMETSAGLCASICAAGLDAQVAYGIPKFRRLPFCGGSMAYKLSIVQNVCGPLGHRLAIQMDDEQLEEDCLMVAICNGSCYGGGFCAAPQASLQDGLLDVIVVRKVSRLRIAKVISLYKTGAHLKNGQVVPELADVILYRKARQVRLNCLDGQPIVATVDGECAPRQELNARVLPLAGRILLPRGVAARQPPPRRCNKAMKKGRQTMRKCVCRLSAFLCLCKLSVGLVLRRLALVAALPQGQGVLQVHAQALVQLRGVQHRDHQAEHHAHAGVNDAGQRVGHVVGGGLGEHDHEIHHGARLNGVVCAEHQIDVNHAE